MLNKVSEYKLPAYEDPEGCSVTVSLNPPYPYVKISGDKIIFEPKDYNDVGVHSLDVILTDLEGLYSSKNINFNVNNSPPVVSGIIQP
jgi:hypothetical protein